MEPPKEENAAKKNKQTAEGEEPRESAGEKIPGPQEGREENDAVRQLREDLARKEKELEESKNQMLRLRADTDNFRKRIAKEKSDFALFANEKLLKELIGIYQNLERALAAPDVNIKSLKEGVEMILKQFTSFLEKEKVLPIPALGEKFDPSKHEALAQVESDKHEENTVVEEYSKGYFLHERVLLPARVVISKKPAGAAPGAEASEDKPETPTPADSK
ncbi:MAG: nucleotide exchange factor GrpE [Nitrospinae bacterium]|nr:nucleotide exchange factor GrpE [Nitrospinota bacterium]